MKKEISRNLYIIMLSTFEETSKHSALLQLRIGFIKTFYFFNKYYTFVSNVYFMYIERVTNKLMNLKGFRLTDFKSIRKTFTH